MDRGKMMQDRAVRMIAALIDEDDAIILNLDAPYG